MKLEAKHRLLANRVLVTLDGAPFDKKQPYARIETQFVWDAGSAEEKILPTLDWVFVPPKLRGKGLGKKLIAEVLREMKRLRLPYLVFDNYETDFWDAMATTLKGQIDFFQKRRLGVLKLKSSPRIENPWSTP